MRFFSSTLLLALLPLMIASCGNTPLFGERTKAKADGTCEPTSCVNGDASIVAPLDDKFHPKWETGFCSCLQTVGEPPKDLLFKDGECTHAECTEEGTTYVAICPLKKDGGRAEGPDCICACIDDQGTGL